VARWEAVLLRCTKRIDGPRRCAQGRWRLVIAVPLLYACASGPSADDARVPSEDAAAETSPGYPPTTSRLTLRLSEELQKLCHATLIDPAWALTAAHCFAGVNPAARGALNEFGRSLAASDVVFYPGALRSGSTSLDTVVEAPDFVAADDLALVPVSPPLVTVAPVARWLPVAGCSLPSPLDVRGRFGQLGPERSAQTAEATLLELVPAAALLGPEQPGSLWSARGPSVGPGDSGSGVTSRWEDLEPRASGCQRSADGVDGEVLMGVIQDANPEQATLPFGLIPLHLPDHARWIATILAAPHLSAPIERPRLDP
jgi:trypsin